MKTIILWIKCVLAGIVYVLLVLLLSALWFLMLFVLAIAAGLFGHLIYAMLGAGGGGY